MRAGTPGVELDRRLGPPRRRGGGRQEVRVGLLRHRPREPADRARRRHAPAVRLHDQRLRPGVGGRRAAARLPRDGRPRGGRRPRSRRARARACSTCRRSTRTSSRSTATTSYLARGAAAERRPQPPFDYRPLPRRPRIAWPGGARVAVWVALNVEHYPIDRPGLSIVPVTAGIVPDPMNYGWRDYGARVGIWRADGRARRARHARSPRPLHAEVCARYPQIVEAGSERDWAWMAHGARQRRGARRTSSDDERRIPARLRGRRSSG